MAFLNGGSRSVQFWDDVDNHSNVQGNFEYGISSLTQRVRIAWDDQVQATLDILGDNYVLPGAANFNFDFPETNLVRVPPLQHAIYSSYYATSCKAAGGINPTGMSSNPLGIGNPVARFEYVYLDIFYNTLPYSVEFESGFDGDEYHRFTTHIVAPSIEFLKVGRPTDGQQLYNYTSTNAAVNNKQVNFGATTIVQKGDLMVKWFLVPEEFIFFEGVPGNIADGVGCVNNNNFQGWSAGSLLLLPPQFEIFIHPTDPVNPNHTPHRLYNITFPFKFFDPPQFPGDVGTFLGGHNSAPWQDGNYYNVKNSAGNGLYPTYNFKYLFAQNVQAGFQ